MSALLTVLVVGSSIAANDPHLNATTVLKLNDTTVNSTLALYPFFILDFYETGCEPCQRMNATLSELARELSGQAAFGTIDVEKSNVTAKIYNITSYPTLLIFENGTLVDSSLGFGSKTRIVNKLKRWKPDLDTHLILKSFLYNYSP